MHGVADSRSSDPYKRSRIVINGRFAGRAITGVERYASEIVRALDELIKERHPLVFGLEFVLAVPKGIQVRLPLKCIAVVPTGRFSGYLWEQLSLRHFAKGDLVLNLCNLAPVFRSQNITCVHDANVWLIPENYSRPFLVAYSLLLPLVIRSSRCWLTVSRYSSHQLTALGIANRPPDLITPNGADHALRWDARNASLRSADLPSRYVIALGSRSKNKNLALIYSIAELIEPLGITVIVAGRSNRKIFGNGEPISAHNVHELGWVSDDDLAMLLRGAICFLFPPFFEGFGLPPVEAMMLGCPVIASNSSAMPEVLGDAAILCDPRVKEEWVRAIDRLARDGGRRADLIRSGCARAGRYSWRTNAVVMLEQIKEMLKSDFRQVRRSRDVVSTCSL